MIGIPAILLTDLFGNLIGRKMLREMAFKHLTSIRDLKAVQIEKYFSTIHSQVQTLASNPLAVDAMREFKNSFSELEIELNYASAQKTDVDEIREYYEKEFFPRVKTSMPQPADWNEIDPKNEVSLYLQYQYLVKNEHEIGQKHMLDVCNDDCAYSEIHKKYHLFFRDFVDKFGYHDLFLIDSETGYVVYSVFKETDFATSLIDGPYNKSGLADVFYTLGNETQPGDVNLSDFRPYLPSYNAPASFIASPIFDENGRQTGVLALQMPIDEINHVMDAGQNGKTYLVGNDYMTRSAIVSSHKNQEYYLNGDKNSETQYSATEEFDAIHNLNLLVEVRSSAVKRALAGESSTALIENHYGAGILSSFAPVNLEGLNWVIVSEIEAAEAFKPLERYSHIMIMISLVLFLILAVATYFLAYKLSRPLNTLTQYSYELSKHDFSKSDRFSYSGNLDIIALQNDEIGELAQSFQYLEVELSESIKNLKKTTSAKERMEQELNIGRNIQMSMLPECNNPFPDINEIRINASIEPASEVCGDFYDFFFIDENRFCFCIGDVAGKGVPAALMMAVTKTMIKSKAVNDFSTASIITQVNEELTRENNTMMFVSLFTGILNIKTGQLLFTNAGHNPPYHTGQNKLPERIFRTHGPVIGVIKDTVYKEDKIKLSEGEIILLYTDGVTEAMDKNENMFEESRLIDLLTLKEYQSSENIVNDIVNEVKLFTGDTDQSDDITVFAVQYLGKKSKLIKSISNTIKFLQ
jgi:serine phosphatase RsbU (regulator of sigma subunit)